MELSDEVKAVSRMQHYIAMHLDEDITLDAIANVAGYSKYHVIGILNDAIENYPFERFGCERSDDAPYLGVGAKAETGA
ncbi:MAG TPA: helix-turn-helix transcriptional regulator [Tissierellia bacterium]|nr:helix-turn-helix transcriptional regulator [Tissierellia bacterium]